MIARSPEYSLIKRDWKKWAKNQVEFLKPLILFSLTLYVPPILINLQTAGHVVSLQDFVPSSSVITAIVFYMVNAGYDLLRKWATETVYE